MPSDDGIVFFSERHLSAAKARPVPMPKAKKNCIYIYSWK